MGKRSPAKVVVVPGPKADKLYQQARRLIDYCKMPPSDFMRRWNKADRFDVLIAELRDLLDEIERESNGGSQ